MVDPVVPGLKVAKFGGTSVATAAQLAKVAKIVEADPGRRVIVPSAPGKASPEDVKVTDLLYLCHELAERDQDFDRVWAKVVARFEAMVEDLEVSIDLGPTLEDIRVAIEGGASRAFAASRGEALNGRIVAASLDAEFVDAAEVIRFRRRGKINPVTYELIRGRCAGSGRIVVPGFYGSLQDGRIQTFSRGGSDVTGAIIANALDAAVYENWTDVSGVLMTDPRIVPEARPITEITYYELRELAYMGASVLHEEAVFPVRAKGIPINLRNTNDPDAVGTMILPDRDPGSEAIVGIAGRAGFTIIYMEKAMMNAEVGFGRRFLDVIERHGISYEHSPTGIDTMSVIVDDEQLGDDLDAILEECERTLEPDHIGVFENMALIATVGKGMMRRVGVAATLFGALAEAEVNVRMIDQGSSEQNIIVGVEAPDLPEAIRAIYHAFVR